MKKTYALASLLLILSWHLASANIYYVTNNNVGGTGSLGSAINSANAHIGKDSIYFNIPASSVAARTIVLSNDSLLPNLKDTTILDGSTQPLGNSFGVSTSKIQLTSLDTASTGLVVDVTAYYSEIYGLWISHFATGVKLQGANFIFGSINHGNVVNWCRDFCIKISYLTGGTMVATFVGIDTTGTLGTAGEATGVFIDNSKKITLGGKQQSSRNVMSGCYIGLKLSDSKYITIQGNYLGTDITTTLAIPNSTGLLATETADGNTNNILIGGDSAKYVNVISGNLQRGLDLDMTNSTVQGNMIGTDLAGVLKLGNGSYGIYVRGGGVQPAHDIAIGGLNPTEANVIAYNGQEGVYLQDAGAHNISVRGNRMFCNSQISGVGGFIVNGGNQGVYPPTIVIVSQDFVSGNTYPDALIDVYGADSCNLCEGADYLGSVLADTNGIFTATFPFSGSVTVTANDTFGNTSAFAECKDSSTASCVLADFYKSKNKVCTGEALQLTDQSISVPGNPIVGWDWLMGDGQTFTVQNPTVTFSAGGTYAITLIATSSAGCSDTTVDSITVKDGVVANFFSDQDVCFGTPVSFSDASVALGTSYIVQWFWDLGDGSTSSFTDFTHDYLNPGDFIVSLNVLNNNSCSGIYTDTVHVHAAPTASFSLSADACVTNPIPFTDLSIPSIGTSITSWMWDFGDGNTSTDQNPSHLYTASGSYIVTLAVSDNVGCADSTLQGITILAGAIANFSWTSSGTTVSFINNSTFNADYSMSWDFGDGSTSTLQTPTHTYTSFGSYVVCLIVNDYTCDQSDTLCQTVLITGIDDISPDSKVTIFPNPAMDHFTVSLAQGITATSITLLNTVGQEIFSQATNSNPELSIALPEVTAGMYWVKIETSLGPIMKRLQVIPNK